MTPNYPRLIKHALVRKEGSFHGPCCPDRRYYYYCACGEMTYTQDEWDEHLAGSLDEPDADDFTRLFNQFIDLAWRRIGTYLAAAARKQPQLRGLDPQAASLISLDLDGALFAWPAAGQELLLPYEYLTLNTYEFCTTTFGF